MGGMADDRKERRAAPFITTPRGISKNAGYGDIDLENDLHFKTEKEWQAAA